MAKASKSGTSVLLELTGEEAQMLFEVIRRVGGSPFGSRRALADNIFITLGPLVTRTEGTDDVSGAIYFEER